MSVDNGNSNTKRSEGDLGLGVLPITVEDRTLIRWLWQNYLRDRIWLLGAALLLMALEGSMMGAFSYLIRPLFDDVLIAGRSDMILWAAGGVCLVFVMRATAGLSHKALSTLVAERVTAQLQMDLLRHLLRLDQGFFQRHPPGSLIDRVRGDSQAMNGLFNRVLPALGRDLVAVVVLLGVALSTDPLWTLIAVMAAPLIVVPIMLLQRFVRRITRGERQASASNSKQLDEIFHGITTIQLTGEEARESQRFGRVLDRFVGAKVRSSVSQASIPALIDIIAAIGFAGVVVYGGAQIIEGERTVGQLMSFVAAMVLLFDPLRNLGEISGAWQAALASLERMYGIFDTRPVITSPDPVRAPLPARDNTRIELRSVGFSYGQDKVLRGADLVAETGQTTAIVGPSGAGKSTVFALLTRLVDPQEGGVFIGGHDIRGMDLAGLRRQFAVVTQDTALFDESLRDNILLGAGEVSESQLADVLQAAHVTEFLDILPQGLDTQVGPRGSALSGGQRQRVAIARALLRDAPILLLDEATSALDAKSEALVQAALDRLSEGRTTLVIAHRLATVRQAEKIVVMDRGRVVEQGTHGTLLHSDGVYAGLHRLQFNDTRT